MFTKKIVAALLGVGMTMMNAEAAVVSGSIEDWASGSRYRLSLVTGEQILPGDPSYATPDFSLLWSLTTYDQGRFTSPSASYAHAPGIDSIEQLTNAASLTYTPSGSSFIGPYCDGDCAANGVGEFVVWYRPGKGYLALQIEDIEVTDWNAAEAALWGTWWYQTDGTGNFGAVSEVPVPASLGLFSSALAIVGLAGRRRKASV